MTQPDPTQHSIITTNAVLTGLTPLIPIPFVDDLVYTQFMRQMTRRLAASQQVELSSDAIRVLSDAPSGGCLPGCLSTVLIYPIKKIFRKIFYFLEWKRAADIVSYSYYHGYLLNAALRENYLSRHEPQQVRAALDRVLQRVDTRPIERSVRHIFRQSKGVLRGASQLLADKLSSRTREAEVAQAVQEVESQEEQQVSGIVSQLQQAFSSLPAEHFEELEKELARELGDVSVSGGSVVF